MQKDKNYDFPILFDENLALAETLGLKHGFPDDLKEVYDGFGVNLPTINGSGEWTLPMPARYIIDSSGLIRDSAINPNYTKRPDPKETVELLRMIA